MSFHLRPFYNSTSASRHVPPQCVPVPVAVHIRFSRLYKFPLLCFLTCVAAKKQRVAWITGLHSGGITRLLFVVNMAEACPVATRTAPSALLRTCKFSQNEAQTTRLVYFTQRMAKSQPLKATALEGLSGSDARACLERTPGRENQVIGNESTQRYSIKEIKETSRAAPASLK